MKIHPTNFVKVFIAITLLPVVLTACLLSLLIILLEVNIARPLFGLKLR